MASQHLWKLNYLSSFYCWSYNFNIEYIHPIRLLCSLRLDVLSDENEFQTQVAKMMSMTLCANESSYIYAEKLSISSERTATYQYVSQYSDALVSRLKYLLK